MPLVSKACRVMKNIIKAVFCKGVMESTCLFAVSVVNPEFKTLQFTAKILQSCI